MEPLPKCPCCGASDAELSYDDDDIFNGHYAKCVECGLSTGRYESKALAILAWSTRNGIPPAAPTEVPSGGVAGAAEGVRVPKPGSYVRCSYCGKWSCAEDEVSDDVCPRCKHAGCMSGWHSKEEVEVKGGEVPKRLTGPELAAVIGEVNGAK